MKSPKLDPKNMPADVVGWVLLSVAWVCIFICAAGANAGWGLAGFLIGLVAFAAGIIAIPQKKYWAGLIQLSLSPLVMMPVFWKLQHQG